MTTQSGFVPLTPLSFLERTADVFPNKPAVITGSDRRETYSSFRAGAIRVAHALRTQGIAPGDRVAILARNGPDLLRMHYAVPGVGAALVAMNTRLSPDEYRYILSDSNASALFVEPKFRNQIQPVLSELSCAVIELPDADTQTQSAEIGVAYSEWLDAVPDTGRGLDLPASEDEPLAINYTSGTTGRPKGAVYTHRGAYLNALGVALELQMSSASIYLWTLPMFHCNGWCCTWAVTAVGGTHVTLADFNPQLALELIDRHDVTHLCGAPVVLNAIADAGKSSDLRFNHPVQIATGGAPPAPTTIAAMRDLGIDVIHLYGLTETYGPSIVCEVQPEWAELDAEALARLMSRQGVRTINVDGVRVVDDEFEDVPADGETMGEIIIRSNTVIPRYHGTEGHSAEVFHDGWLRTGDLAVMHPDGYVEVRDRRKDIIISGGENVSSIEVENLLASHPEVAEAAVVAAPHEKWGEVPIAYVSLRQGGTATEEDLIAFVREQVAHFKAPKVIVFEDLPKTSTGKIQKYELRERARFMVVER